MSAEISIIPWPQYSDDGRNIVWQVRVEVPKFRGTLQWSTRSGRFHRDNHAWRLRRGSPKIYRAAVEMMVDFCATEVTEDSLFVTENSDSVTSTVVTCLARARGGYALGHGCHSDNQPCDCDRYCDSDNPSQTGSLRDPSAEESK